MRISHDIDPQTWPELWRAAYRVLETEISESQLRAWIQPLEFKESRHGTNEQLEIFFEAPNDFSASWVRDRFKSHLQKAFGQITGQPCEVAILAKNGQVFEANTESSPPTSSRESNYLDNVSSSRDENVRPTFLAQEFLTPSQPIGERTHPAVENTSRMNPLAINPFDDHHDETPPYTGGVSGTIEPGDELISNPTITMSAPQEKARIIDSKLNPLYTFENFVVGASNEFAHASALAVAEHPAKQYNPFFIYSPPGLGKTHLLHAIGNHYLKRSANARVAYLSAEQFTNELVEAILRHKMDQFRSKFRNSFDLLLIDDIQFIVGKDRTEEEFFHTFNTLHSSKRQIVITSDRPPKEIEGLQERIRTRFEWGLLADIQPPEIETRIAVLKAKAERDDIYLTDEVATFLATYVKSNMRELEGTLVKMQAQASLSGAEISIEMAKAQLKNIVPEESNHYTAETILAAVAKFFDIKMSDFKSNTRARNISFPRQIAMYLIRKYTGMGYKEISAYFGGKNHSTIIYSCTKTEQSLDTDSEIRAAVEGIQNLL
jgi:chromosomal replication initiator protein